jgi:hypothetical protein
MNPLPANDLARAHKTAPNTMQKLRSIHLDLGCIFAPLLLFFVISGVWQTLGLRSHLLDRLSTIHTSHMLKSNDGMSSYGLRFFVLMMTLSFIITTVLGIAMAVKFGRNRRAAYYCLAAGVALPMLLILISLLS